VPTDAAGVLGRLEDSELTAAEATELGALIGALVGFGAGRAKGAGADGEIGAATAAANGTPLGGRDVWFLADAIAPGTAAAIVLLEHRWAIPLRAAIEAAGDPALEDAWIHPRDLAAIGARGA
jgi:hypothetical protein